MSPSHNGTILSLALPRYPKTMGSVPPNVRVAGRGEVNERGAHLRERGAHRSLRGDGNLICLERAADAIRREEEHCVMVHDMHDLFDCVIVTHARPRDAAPAPSLRGV